MDNDKLVKLFDATFNKENDASITVLQLIMALCGYDQVNMRMDTQGNISETSNLYNEGRRSVYLDIRKYISDEMLFEIEIKRRRENAKRERIQGDENKKNNKKKG